DPRNERIAVMRSHYGILLDGEMRTPGDIRVVGRLERPLDWNKICLLEGDVLVVSEGSQLERWDLSFSQYIGQSWWKDLPRAFLPVRTGGWDVIWIRTRDEICYMDGSGDPNVHYVDRATLNPVMAGRELTDKRATILFSSADAACHALGGDGYADIAV